MQEIAVTQALSYLGTKVLVIRTNDGGFKYIHQMGNEDNECENIFKFNFIGFKEGITKFDWSAS